MMTLRELRKKHNMTQVACAKYLGIPLRTYQNYERDDANPNTIKYQFLMEKLEKYGFIDETHGILSIEQIKNVCEPILSQYKVIYLGLMLKEKLQKKAMLIYWFVQKLQVYNSMN